MAEIRITRRSRKTFAQVDIKFTHRVESLDNVIKNVLFHKWKTLWKIYILSYHFISVLSIEDMAAGE